VTDLLVNIDVDDLAKAVAFYQHAFGLKVARRFADSGVELAGSSSPIFLLVKSEATTPAPTTGDLRRYGRHWTPVHLDFVTTDVEAAVTRAVAAGATLEGPITTHKWGRIATMADPFGHGFCLIEFLGRGYDEIAER
jgi:predicted enzyme related to lactoylglutathione lyase